MVAIRSDSQLVLFGRLFWMMLGPAVLFVCAVLILNAPRTGWGTIADIVYWIAAAGMVFGRYVEHRGGDPHTSTGEPATDRDLRRYAIVALIIAAVVWVVANVISNYVL